MRVVKGKDTALELRFRSLLWRHGIRGYRCHLRSVTGTPDVAWKGIRVAVFIDSAWWHGHPSRWTPGRLPGTWDAKIARNRERDEEVAAALLSRGWLVVCIWDFEIEKDPERSAVLGIAFGLAACSPTPARDPAEASALAAEIQRSLAENFGRPGDASWYPTSQA